MRLRKHRECDRFRRRLFGTLSTLETLKLKLADASEEWSTNDVMYIGFKDEQEEINAFMSSQENLEHLVDAYPTEAVDLLALATDLDQSLTAIRQCRWDFLQHYIKPDGSDLHRDTLEPGSAYNAKDRGAMRGMTEAQQIAYEAQLCPLGFIKLSQAERKRWHDVVAAELQRLDLLQ
jgi:hypothetical protein